MLAVVVVLVLSQILASQTEVSTYIPHTAQDVSRVALEDGGSHVALAAWSQPSKNGPGFDTAVVAVSGTGKQTKAIWHLKLPGAYSPNLVEKSEFKYQGKTVVLLRVQFGAAAAKMFVLAVKRDRVLQLGAIEADDFECVNMQGATYLVAHDYSDMLDVPLLYRWTGTAFIDDSQHHPQFYRELAAQIRKESDVTKFAEPAQLGFAQILRLSGEQPPVPAK